MHSSGCHPHAAAPSSECSLSPAQVLVRNGNHYLIPCLRKMALSFIDKGHIESGDDFGNDDADVMSTLLAKVHSQFVCDDSPSARQLPISSARFPPSHLPVSPERARETVDLKSQFPCNIHDGYIFCHISFSFLLYVLAKILIFYESNNKNREIFLGTVAENGNSCRNGCEKRAVFFLIFSKIVLSLQREKEKRFFKSLYSYTKQRINNIKGITIKPKKKNMEQDSKFQANTSL